MPKYIHDELGQEWMLNYDGAAVTGLPVSAGNLPLEKRGEFRVASGATIPNLGKIEMESTDESGIVKSIRGHVPEVAKPLLSAATENRFGTTFSACSGGSSSVGETPSLELPLKEHQTLPRRQPVQRARASWRCQTRACTSRANRGRLDQNGRG